jgi:hypothetical protein
MFSYNGLLVEDELESLERKVLEIVSCLKLH